MNIRMTLTAVALGTMTLAGCETMNTPAAPAAAPAPVSGATPSGTIGARPGLSDATGTAVGQGAEATTIPGVDMMDRTPDDRMGIPQVAGAPPVSGNTPNNLTRPGLSDATGTAVGAGAEATTIPGVDMMDRTPDNYRDVPQVAGAAPVSGNTPNNLTRPGLSDATGSSVGAGAEATTIPGVDAYDRSSDDTVVTMMDDGMAADDGAMNACFAAGGQVIAWVGDPTGVEQACQREDGLIYRLADARYYQ